MPPIALWLCFAALAQPRWFRQPQNLDASRSSQKAEQHFNKSLSKAKTRCSRLQRTLTAALVGLVPRSRHLVINRTTDDKRVYQGLMFLYRGPSSPLLGLKD